MPKLYITILRVFDLSFIIKKIEKKSMIHVQEEWRGCHVTIVESIPKQHTTKAFCVSAMAFSSIIYMSDTIISYSLFEEYIISFCFYKLIIQLW